jgi:hypothetical protein
VLRLRRLVGILLAAAVLACGHEHGFFCRAELPDAGGCVYWLMAWCDGTEEPRCDSGVVPLEGSRTDTVSGCTNAPEHGNGLCND